MFDMKITGLFQQIYLPLYFCPVSKVSAFIPIEGSYFYLNLKDNFLENVGDFWFQDIRDSTLLTLYQDSLRRETKDLFPF